jgi:hypothetical protein
MEERPRTRRLSRELKSLGVSEVKLDTPRTTRARAAMGRKELEALGAIEEIAEMDRAPPLSRKRKSRSPKRSSPKRSSPKKSSPKKSPPKVSSPKKSPPEVRDTAGSPLGTLNKRTRAELCREIGGTPIIEQLGLKDIKKKIEMKALDAIKKEDRTLMYFYENSKENLDFVIDNFEKKIEQIDKLVDEYCRKGKEKNEMKLVTPKKGEEIKSLITKSLIKKIFTGNVILNIAMIYLEEKYKHLDICFYNPENKVMDFSDLDFLKIDIRYEKGKEEEAYLAISYPINENRFKDFIENCKKRYVAGLYLMRVTAKGEGFSNDYHTNAFLYDKKTGFLQLMEPYGFLSHLNYLPERFVYKLVDEQMARILPKPYSWRTVNVDFQDAESAIKREKSEIDPWGFCVYWSVWLLEQKIDNLNKDITEHLNEIKPTLGDLRRYIRGYSVFINSIMSDLEELNHEISVVLGKAIPKAVDEYNSYKTIKDIIIKLHILSTLD